MTDKDKLACEYCQGAGETFEHSDNCRDDLCALNGDEHSCNGQVIPCSCTNQPDPGRTCGLCHGLGAIDDDPEVPGALTECYECSGKDKLAEAIEFMTDTTAYRYDVVTKDMTDNLVKAARAYAELPGKIEGMKVDNVTGKYHPDDPAGCFQATLDAERNSALDDILKMMGES